MGFLDTLIEIGTFGLGEEKGKSSGSGIEFATVPQTKAAEEARARLTKISKEPPPAIPLRGTAPLEPMGEERILARETAKELAQPQDFLSLPEVQAIIAEAREAGDLLTNRLGRGLQKVGAAAGTPGRDVLGRAVSEVEQGITARLAPFAQEERARRERQIGTLETLGLTEEFRKQGFGQAELDALFSQEFGESRQVQDFIIPLLQSIIGLQPGIIPILPQEKPSFLSQIAPILGPALGGLLSRSPAGGGTATQFRNPANAAPGALNFSFGSNF